MKTHARLALGSLVAAFALSAGAELPAPPVPQDGKTAAALRENLQRIKLPPGFKIELLAIVPNARHLAVGPQGKLVMVGTRLSTVWAVALRPGATMASEVRAFAPAQGWRVPNGVCWSADGALLVAEHNRVLRFAKAEAWRPGSALQVSETVPQGQLIPAAE
ncbi:MAG: hypothetical protein KA375_15135, partial [Vitreoscilla sp.]|nr:hypothetical protein [Vitreoscilla sp.]MBP6677028.1 hypothetical protein [Vitreoscilla sp.]